MNTNYITRGAASFLAAIAIIFLPAMSADAGIVDLGGGWQASWDSSLDPYVDVNLVEVTVDTIFIQKSAQFTQAPVNGIFPSIPILFQQIGESTIQNIVIDDEIITNSTGVDWTDFHMDLLDGGDARFNPEMTAQSGGGGPIGFSIAPFTQVAFTNPQRLDIWGGVVPDGGIWFPGDGATDGQLWIDVVSSRTEPGTVFVLKETPTPEPATLLVLGLGLMLGLARRRVRA